MVTESAPSAIAETGTGPDPGPISGGVRRSKRESRADSTPAVMFSFQVVAGTSTTQVRLGTSKGASSEVKGDVGAMERAERRKAARFVSAVRVVEVISLAVVHLLLTVPAP